MHQLLQNYLSAKREEEAASLLKKKNDLLISLGLFEKKYSETNTPSSEYPESEWDYQAGVTKYFKSVPVQVSDEEYSEILKYQKEEAQPKNKISSIFKVLAWIVFISGFIAGIVFGRVEVDRYYSSYTEFSFALALVYWVVSFMSGMTFMGFAEIIQLLYDIKNK